MVMSIALQPATMHQQCVQTNLPDIVLGAVRLDARRLLGVTTEPAPAPATAPTTTAVVPRLGVSLPLPRCAVCQGTVSRNNGFSWCTCDDEDSVIIYKIPRPMSSRPVVSLPNPASRPSVSISLPPSPRVFIPEDSPEPCSDSPEPLYKNLDPAYCRFTDTHSPEDLLIIGNTLGKLSKCGFYYKNMTMSEARAKLRRCSVGTFLLRDSSQKGYLFAISAKTIRGTTSVRIEYSGGHFHLDSETNLKSKLPKFKCVLDMVDYLVKFSADDSNNCVWLESSGRKDTPVVLKTPLLDTVLSLKDVCRRRIHSLVPADKLSALPGVGRELTTYLQDYPNSI